ncbi:RTA1-domain-containing protein [Pleurostoma richardsiae]|uniref:RTA1-domain-containing protein n=1 Tax=Pleurostoma richardsiae TaxID=41990 RepID=A0AA38VJY2_9PEZI|nr:RTA1-domain-containing protein [Pleurostoma richardsiae]
MSDGSDQYSQEFLDEIQEGCHALIDGLDPSYGYVPSLGAGIAFCVLFGICLLGHTAQFARLRRWTSILLALGAVTELIGWAGRTWSAKCPYNNDAFIMQITTLIIAPVFFSAALYVLLGILILQLGRHTSWLSAKWYAIVFCACDIISLVIQAIGGGMASSESDKPNGNTKPGTDIMVGGIVFQLGTMTLFALFFVDFLRRIRGMSVPRNIKLVLIAMVVSFVMIYIRSVYRTVELLQGWDGYLITHEGYFIGLDAAIMVVAVAVLLALDPASLIPKLKKGTIDAGDTTDDAEQQREKVVSSGSESER